MKKDIYYMLEGGTKNFTFPVRMIFWTGFIILIAPFSIVLCIIFALQFLLQTFYIIRYPFDLYLYNLLKTKGSKKPELKWIID
ncbi:hypothetical protein LCGC14_0374030 [marine sediment metagenome]|uniref:Uncharacterized protein n=1 Tax=marine sediment metagenome TaxID=412755 RepID=A0A0F9WCT4_9ZZZZ